MFLLRLLVEEFGDARLLPRSAIDEIRSPGLGERQPMLAH